VQTSVAALQELAISGHHAAIGFDSPDEVRAAQPAEPLPVFMVRLDQLADADVAPALRRAVIAGDERIRHLSSQPLRGLRFAPTSAGSRKNLQGIGASALVALVTGETLWLAHVSENEAYLLRGGRARRLVQAHTLANLADYRRKPSEHVHMADQIVLRVLGFGDSNADLTRAKLEPGDRLIFGNAGLTTVVGPGEVPALAFADLDALASELEAGMGEKAFWSPSTFAIVDVEA
jgi:hypothetical protein